MDEKKTFLTWPKLIIFAIIAGVYTAIMAIIPSAKNTSFADITISFEVWILFGILIIMNSKSNLDSALKCFVFFLISQPLVYLIQVPFSAMGLGILAYYKNWIVWTILTIPMGFIGYYMKKDKWWSLLILLPMILFLGLHFSGFLNETLYYFPHHLISACFCVLTMILYPILIFKNTKNRIVGLIISIVCVIVFTVIVLSNRKTYNTVLLTNGDTTHFDDSYNVYLEDSRFGDVYIKYDDGLEDYLLNASFSKAGKTKLILESPDGSKEEFELTIKNDSYDLEKK